MSVGGKRRRRRGRTVPHEAPRGLRRCTRCERVDVRTQDAASLRWSVGHGVVAAYSTAADGDCRQDGPRRSLLARWGGPADCIVAMQVHGTRVARVAPGQAPGEADGLVTTAPAALGAFGADCPGLCIATPHALAVAHCGWRGTAGGIVHRLVEALEQAAPQDPRARWRALVGPGIAGCDYQVDGPVIAARPWPPSALQDQGGGHALLDLAEAIACDLAALGIAQVARTQVNTRRDPRLHSHRGAGPGVPQLMAAWRA
jgi:copper oxidase (laccase) domain-containing protein